MENAKEKSITSSLAKIQKDLKAPKSRHDAFHGFDYRSVSDILEAVKPLAAKEGCTVTLTDDLVQIGTRYYIKATARICNGPDFEEATGYAREDEGRKGMDSAQLTGSTSSYARKYALNGLFAIDDTADIDTVAASGSGSSAPTPAQQAKADAEAVKNRIEFEAWLGKYKSLLLTDTEVMATAKSLAQKYPKTK